MNDNRPDSKKILEQILVDKQETQRGKLKIFLGAAAGVGKTYAMLQAAKSLFADGVDVVIGYVETHNRSDVIATLPSYVECIPLKSMEYNNRVFYEFDIDAALERHPDTVIVDELAHTNIPGSRNNKRYLDILELLNAGINVYTALNIQHIESLNDTIEGITNIHIQETVPDQIINDADKVTLIDLPPDEIITRLVEGKIYAKERIQSALNNFFRKGNLTALRKLALRVTAQKVDQQMVEYRSEHDIELVWGSSDKLLVVVDLRYSPEKIIRIGKNMFDKGFNEWVIGYIDSEENTIAEKQKLLTVAELAKQMGAEVVKLIGIDDAATIIKYAQDNNIHSVVISQHKHSLWSRLFTKTTAERISELAPEISLSLVNEDIPNSDKSHAVDAVNQIDYWKIFKSIGYFGVIFTALGAILQPFSLVSSRENILMIYLLVIIVSNHKRGKLSAIIASIIATSSFDFFFVAPIYTFEVVDSDYITTFVILAALGVTFSSINGNLRYQVSQLKKQLQQNEVLNLFGRQLAIVVTVDQLVAIVQNYFDIMFSIKCAILLVDKSGQLKLLPMTDLDIDMQIAKWVLNNAQNAGAHTNTFANNELHYTPLIAGHNQAFGVLSISAINLDFFLPSTQDVFVNAVNQLVITIERINLMNAT